MPSGTGATKSGCKVTTIFANYQTFSRFFAFQTQKSYKIANYQLSIISYQLSVIN